MTCHIPDCDQPPTGYGNICAAHRTRMSRHGDHQQKAITKEMLSPYVKAVRKRRRKNAENLLWGNLELRWLRLLENARSIEAQFKSGRPGHHYEYVAAQQVIRLAETEPASIVDTVLGMYLLRYDRGGLFWSEKSFRTQVVRRVRALGSLHAGTWFDHHTNRLRSAYRNLPPRASAVVGGWLSEILGGPGVYLANLEQGQRKKAHQEQQAMHQSLEQLK